MTTEIVFSEERTDYLLDLFGKEVDDSGYIIDSETKERVKSTTDEYLQKDDLGYVGHNSVHFVEDDISTIIDYLSEESEQD